MFPDLQSESQQQQLAHHHQSNQMQQTSIDSSPGKPMTIAAAARKRALSNAPTEPVGKKRPATNRRRHEPTIAAAQALVNATVVGGCYTLGDGINNLGREGSNNRLSMFDSCRIPLKTEANTPRHFDADVDDTSTRSSSVPPIGENGEPCEFAI